MIPVSRFKTLIPELLLLTLILSFSFSLSVYGSNGAARMYLFYSVGCRDCREIKESFLKDISEEYSSLIEVKLFDIEDMDNYRFMTELEEKYGTVKNPPPTIFVGDKLLDGKEEILNNLRQIIESCIETGGCDWPDKEKPVSTGENIIEKFEYLGVAAVIGAGLLDGINPCAFSTIIILVLYLTFTGYKRSEILKTGIFFTIAVFLAYFLIGIGLLEFIARIEFLPVVSRIITLLFGAVAIILGFLSLYDFYKIKKLIWKKSGRKYYFVSVFFIGFLIGILEFPCTGQIYFPIVLVLREVPSLRLHALSYLVLYNLMFIVPLVVVFAFVFFGTTSGKLVGFLEKRSGIIKIFTAILFFTLGMALIFFGKM
jgi:cytochrome c biogenesis protein CcdA